MASRKIYIDNGTNLGWDTQVAISYDGVAWSSVPKAGMKVLVHQLNFQTASPGNVDIEPSGDVITLMNVADTSTYARFHIEDVANQPTWTTTALALQDINEWLVS